jgi:hypothetical protein
MMPGKYATQTDVPVSRSRDEIERTLTRFGASAFGYAAASDGRVMITFEVHNLRVQMRMHLPDKKDFALSPTGKWRTEAVQEREWEQACRQRWRSLANGIKAKLALVDDGISSVEREFMPDIMTPDGRTIGEKLLPEITAIARGGYVPSLMPAIEAKVIELPTRTG